MVVPIVRELQISAALGDPFCRPCLSQSREFRAVRRQLARLIFDGKGSPFAIIDPARSGDACSWLRSLGLPTVPLLYDDLDSDLLAVSPMLVEIDCIESFETIFLKTWGSGQGFFVQARQMSIVNLGAHLRGFTSAELPDGEVAIFRFWDPRVMVRFLKVADAEQSAEFFNGGISAVHLEGDRGTLTSHKARQVEPQTDPTQC